MEENMIIEQEKLPIVDYNPLTAYVSMFKKYAVFKGRSRRSEYWFAYLSNCILCYAIYMIAIILGFVNALRLEITSNAEALGAFMPSIIIIGLLVLYSFAAVVPWLAMTVRRLHDVGRSGKWLFAPFISTVVAVAGSVMIFIRDYFNDGLNLMPGLIVYFIGIIMCMGFGITIFVFTVLDSKPGANKYGPNPKGIE